MRGNTSGDRVGGGVGGAEGLLNGWKRIRHGGLHSADEVSGPRDRDNDGALAVVDSFLDRNAQTTSILADRVSKLL